MTTAKVKATTKVIFIDHALYSHALFLSPPEDHYTQLEVHSRKHRQ